MRQHITLELSAVELRLLVKSAVRDFFLETGMLKALSQQDTLLIVEDVASMLRISNKAIYRLIKDGRLEAVKRGKRFFVLRSNVMAYLNADSDAETTANHGSTPIIK